MRCEVGGKGAKGVKVTCKVTYGGKASRADERKLSGHAAKLLRGGKVYAAGTVGHLLSRRSLAPGALHDAGADRHPRGDPVQGPPRLEADPM